MNCVIAVITVILVILIFVVRLYWRGVRTMGAPGTTVSKTKGASFEATDAFPARSTATITA
jgi:hypothetical protein